MRERRVHVHRVRHDLRRHERVHDLLDGDGAHQREQRRPTELTKMPTTAARAPPSHGPMIGNDVQEAGDAAQGRVVRDAHHAEQDARRPAPMMAHCSDAFP